jgi:ComF family protein
MYVLAEKRRPSAPRPAQGLARTLFFLREYFFPFGCALCGSGLTGLDETWYGLCGNCRQALEGELTEAGEGERCGLCGRPLISEHDRCLSCRTAGAEYAFDRVIALFPYTGKYRTLLGAYKFGKNLALGHFFAERIAAAVIGGYGSPDQCASPGPVNFAVIPVPPRPGKIKKTGWDQIEYLAGLLEKEFPVRRCLKRLASKVQKELTREERKKNLQGRIVVNKSPPKTALVIDDVMTTGSTLDVCAAALKAGGAEKVYGISLFYGCS